VISLVQPLFSDYEEPLNTGYTQPQHTNISKTATYTTTGTANPQPTNIAVHQDTGHTITDKIHNVAEDLKTGVKNLLSKNKESQHQETYEEHTEYKY